jgi:hypothetical protein
MPAFSNTPEYQLTNLGGVMTLRDFHDMLGSTTRSKPLLFHVSAFFIDVAHGIFCTLKPDTCWEIDKKG